MASNFNLRANEDDIEELLEVIPEEWTHEELLELECIAEEEVREKETTGGKKKGDPSLTPPKFTLKGLAEALSDLDKLLNSLKI